MSNKVENIRWKHVQKGATQRGFLHAATAMAFMDRKPCPNKKMYSWDNFDLQNPETWVMLPPNCLHNYEHAD